MAYLMLFHYPRVTIRPLAKPVTIRRFNCCSLLSFSILLLNIRSVNSSEKRAMLSAQLERFEPDILALNETWLDASVAKVDLPAYQLVSRRDRPTTRMGKANHGGVNVYSRVGAVLVTH